MTNANTWLWFYKQCVMNHHKHLMECSDFRPRFSFWTTGNRNIEISGMFMWCKSSAFNNKDSKWMYESVDYRYFLLKKWINNVFLSVLHLLSKFIKRRSPTWHESWLSAEPQHDQHHKNSKHGTFTKFYSAQFLEFLLDHIIGLLITCAFKPTAKCLLKTVKKQKFNT